MPGCQASRPNPVLFDPSAENENKTADETEIRLREVRFLLSGIENAIDTEKRLIVRELHDQVGRNITGLGMALDILKRRTGELSGPETETMESIQVLLDELSGNIRKIMTRLYPGVLDRTGLFRALENLVEELIKQNGVSIQFVNTEQSGNSLPEELKIVLYRVAEEALLNALRHSKSESVRVSLLVRKGEIVLEVEDTGVGFDLSNKTGEDMPGIIRMRERCLAFGGDFFISSRPGSGTLVRTVFSLSGSSDA